MILKLISVLIALNCVLVASAHDIPTCPGATVLTRIEGLSDPRSLIVNGGFAYVLDAGGTTLVTIDADPQNSTIIHTLALSAPGFNDIVIHEDAAYLTNGTNLIQVISLSDPSEPTLASPVHAAGPVIRPVVIDDLMYAGTTDVFDVSDPLNPVLTGSMNIPSPIALHQDGLTYTTRLEHVDLSDPLNPVVSPDAFAHSNESKVFAELDPHARRVYAMGAESFVIIDITDPIQPLPVFSIEFSSPLGFTQPTMLRSSAIVVTPFNFSLYTDFVVTDYGSMGGATYHEYAFKVIDEHTEHIRYALKSSEHCYLITDQAFVIIDLATDPIVASASTQAPINELVKRNDLIFTAEDNHGVAIYHAPQPDEIQLVGSYTGIDTALAVAATDTHLYIAADREDLVIVDMTDISNPYFVKSIDTGIRTRNVKVVDDILYAVDRSTGLTTYDLTDPINPVMLGRVALPGWNEDITFNETFTIAGVTSNTFDSYLIDIADPTDLRILSSITPLDQNGTDRGIKSITFDNDFMYTAEMDEGYRIWDITDPSNPTLIAHHDFSYYDYGGTNPLLHAIAYKVTPLGARLLIANGNNGFAVYDNSDRSNPVFERYIETEVSEFTTSSVRDFIMEDDLVYAAVYGSGIKVYTIEPCWTCIADVNGDATLNFFDVTAFIQAYADQSLSVDFNNDALFNFFDVSAFLTSYASGCP